MSSAGDLQNVLEDSCQEVVDNLNCVKNVLKERLPLNFTPMKFKELNRTEKDCYLIKLCVFMCPLFSHPFVVSKWEMSPLVMHLWSP
jgi:hypothetical protein